MKRGQNKQGFTIVELLIVIVVIAILAAITVVAYNGVQNRSVNSKIDADVAQLYKAILGARVSSGEKSLTAVTGSTGTSGGCANAAAGTDFAALDKASHACWTVYTNTLNILSTASGVDVKGLVDPWGRPYYIDENETVAGSCSRDVIGAFVYPFPGGWTNRNVKTIPTITPGC